MTRWILTLVMMLVAHLAIGGVDATQSKSAPPAPNAPAATPKTIAAGEKLFRAHCSRCHGSTARGDGPEAPPGSHPPNLTDDTWLHGSTDADILNVIRNGVGPKFDMKGFRSRFTTDEMWSLVHYLRSLHASSSR
jgi:mono/diheme cytochrome c family protein